MIHKMYELYRHIPQSLIDEHFSEYGLGLEREKNEKVIVLDLEIDQNRVHLKGTSVFDYDKDNNTSKYFLRNASGNDISPFPTIYLDAKGLDGTDKKEMLKSKSFKKLMRIIKENVDINQDLKPLVGFLTDNAVEVASEIRAKMVVAKGGTNILTLRINNEFLGQSSYFQPILAHAKKNLYSEFYTLGKNRIVGEDQSCSICKSKQKEVWGYVSIYNFYTAKTELAPLPGFRKDRAHVNHPVCPQCADKLYRMRPIVDEYLRYEFCKLNYFLIPEVIKPGDTKTMSEIFDIIKFSRDQATSDTQTTLGGLTLGIRKSIVDSQTAEVFDLIAQEQSYVNYTMLFYEASNSQFKILMTLESIFPYQFQKVFTAKQEAENYAIFKQQKGFVKNRLIDLEFNFSLVKEFFPFSAKNAAFKEYFLEVVRCVFLQKPLSHDFILGRLMSVIRTAFSNDKFTYQTVQKAYLFMLFLKHLDILKDNDNQYMEVQVASIYDEFFKEHAQFFKESKPAQKGVFLLGVLCQKLISIQYRERGAKPFLKKLNGLKLNKDKIEELYPQILNKLLEYDANYYEDLELEISRFLVTDELDRLSNNEISFLFVLGMTLNKEFKSVVDDQKEKNDDAEEES